jgi:tetratricopeptide (TPR) repeat protein
MEESFDELKTKGDNNFKNNDLDIAIMFYSKALLLEENEKTHSVYLNRCLSYFKLGQFEEALDDAIKASKLNPDNAKAWGRVGSCLLALKRTEEANVAFDRAHQLDPLNEEYLKLLNEPKSEEAIDEVKDNNMDEMMKKLKSMKDNMSELPIESLMGPLFNKFMNNQKLVSLATDSNFQNKMLQYKSNPLEAMKDPKIMDLVGDVLKELNLSKN